MAETIALLITGFIPIAGWVLSIHSRVSANESAIGSQKELILSKLEDIDDRLERIERSMNGFLYRD